MSQSIDPELLKILVCPEDRSPLKLADAALLSTVNSRIEGALVKDRGGAPVAQPLEAALVRADGQFLYPIRDGIPVLLIDSAIPSK